MKKEFGVVVVAFLMMGALNAYAAEKDTLKSGEELFKKNCAVCHPKGGNVINPKKTLHAKDLDFNNVRKASDIVKKMRNPGPGMLQFDTAKIPDKEAIEIAEYVLATFK